MRTVQTVAVIGAVLVAMPSFAQQVPAPPPSPPAPAAPPAPPAPTPPRLQILRRPYFRDDSTYLNRPTLGMSISMTGSKRDTLGVFVTRVAPNGPAERAGIVEGDRIVAINDVSLKASPSDLDDPYAMGLAAHRLSRTVSKLAPGTGVKLRVYSGGRTRDVTVTAGRMGDVYRERNRMMIFSDGDMEGMIGPALARIGPSLEMIGPAMRDAMIPALDEIGPTVQRSVERAMREIPRDMPRDIHIEWNDDHR
ncbi:MAG TPA: PDZ domain-containing protein [Candidatus Elarobacter sp.]|nr:PDZ domain-containing protein [Candidatus Elarobacter sp.]